jgi:hypothetical protein
MLIKINCHNFKCVKTINFCCSSLAVLLAFVAAVKLNSHCTLNPRYLKGGEGEKLEISAVYNGLKLSQVKQPASITQSAAESVDELFYHKNIFFICFILCTECLKLMAYCDTL